MGTGIHLFCLSIRHSQKEDNFFPDYSVSVFVTYMKGYFLDSISVRKEFIMTMQLDIHDLLDEDNQRMDEFLNLK